MRIVVGAVVLAAGLGVALVAQAPANVTIEQHEATMKQIAQNNTAMQKAIKSGMLADAVGNAEELAKLFAQVEQFWTRNKKDDAIKLAQTARTGARDVAAAAKAGDQMKAQMAAGNLGGTCKQCHGVYREGDPQNGFNLKPGMGVN